MKEYILTFIIIFLAYLYFKWVIRPKKLMKSYAKMYKDRGYKVIELDYNPIGAPQVSRFYSAAI